MALFMSECEKLDVSRCGAPQASRDEVGARDKANRRIAPQPAQASSSVLTDAPHRSSPSSSPDFDCNMMKSFDNF